MDLKKIKTGVEFATLIGILGYVFWTTTQVLQKSIETAPDWIKYDCCAPALRFDNSGILILAVIGFALASQIIIVDIR